MPPRFRLPTTPVPEDEMLSEVMLRAERTIIRAAGRYLKITPDPALDTDDYYQHMSMLLLEYVTSHREQTAAMLSDENPNYLEKFVSQFCQRRMRDLWEMTLADRRNQALTFNASSHTQSKCGVPGRDTMLETMASDQAVTRPTDPRSARLVDDYLDGLRPLARDIMAALLKPPEDLQESFLAGRTKVAYGQVKIVAPERSYGQSSMILTPREGYNAFIWTVGWEGPLRHGVIQTSHGDMTVSDETDVWKLEFGFPLLVLSDGHEGEYEHKTIRPTPACFDVKAMARYLSKTRVRPVPNCHVQVAWVEAQARYRALFGLPEEPGPQPNHRHAVSA